MELKSPYKIKISTSGIGKRERKQTFSFFMFYVNVISPITLKRI